MGEDTVRRAFAQQAEWCEHLGSPFTARLCAVLAEGLNRETTIGRRVLDWPGKPDSLNDALPLRLAGALHGLVRRGDHPDLAALYPPHPLPGPAALRAAVDGVFRAEAEEIGRWLDNAPQTNEVARSGVLLPGLLVVAAETGLPLDLHELGSSGGLNLRLDRYAYRLGTSTFGDASSAVRIEPSWDGAPPPDAVLRIVARRGVDLQPLDAADPSTRERLPAYVWPDQPERLARLVAALAIAAREPVAIDRADAADWIERRLHDEGPPGRARVVMHSIAFQYFPPDTQRRIAARLEAAGARASVERPLAWLRFEVDPEFERRPSLRLRMWPDGRDRVLALADAHVRRVRWLGAS